MTVDQDGGPPPKKRREGTNVIQVQFSRSGRHIVPTAKAKDSLQCRSRGDVLLTVRSTIKRTSLCLRECAEWNEETPTEASCTVGNKPDLVCFDVRLSSQMVSVRWTP